MLDKNVDRSIGTSNEKIVKLIYYLHQFRVVAVKFKLFTYVDINDILNY